MSPASDPSVRWPAASRDSSQASPAAGLRAAGRGVSRALMIVPDLYDPRYKGGNQVFSGHMVRALRELGVQLRILSVNDTVPADGDGDVIGCGGRPRWRRLRTVWHAFREASTFKPDVVICGHVNFAWRRGRPDDRAPQPRGPRKGLREGHRSDERSRGGPSPCRCVIGGGGEDRVRLARLIESRGLSGRVILTGFVPDEEIVDLYNLCDVFVLPSKKEGFGIVFLEALGCGKPVIAGAGDGSVEAVRGGELGLLVDPDDVGAIRDAILQVLSGRADRRFYDPAGLRTRAVEAFGFDAFRARLGAILDSSAPT